MSAYIDPSRYGYDDMPAVGTLCGAPSGRQVKVVKVVSPGFVTVENTTQGRFTIQANDLRKLPQPTQEA